MASTRPTSAAQRLVAEVGRGDARRLALPTNTRRPDFLAFGAMDVLQLALADLDAARPFADIDGIGGFGPGGARLFDQFLGFVAGIGDAQHGRRPRRSIDRAQAHDQHRRGRPAAPHQRLDRNSASAPSPSFGSARNAWLARWRAAGNKRDQRQPVRLHLPDRRAPAGQRQRIEYRRRRPAPCRPAAGRSTSRRPAHRPPCPGWRRACRSRSPRRRCPATAARGARSSDPGHRRPADQRAPAEHQPQPRLRPPGDALHEGISGDRRQAGQARPTAPSVKLQQDDQADQAKADGQRPRRSQADPRRWPTAEPRPLHLPVEVAVDDVVIDAARRSASRTRRAPATGTGPSARRTPASATLHAQGQ